MNQRPMPKVGEHLIRDGKIDRIVTADGKRTATFVASDESVDRYGDIVRASGWDLRNFRINNVLLWSHQSREPPIGKVPDIHVEGTRLIASVEFRPEGDNAIADDVYKGLQGGFINAVSVGFLPTQKPNMLWAEDDPKHEKWPTGYEYVGQELLELSVVPVPANPQALALARSLAFSDATQRRLMVFDERAGARVVGQRRRNLLTIARFKPGFFNGGNHVA
jgi:HK97 family phage prohead protease